MGYVKNAMIEVHEAGCLWVGEDVIARLRDAGHNPQTKKVVIEGFKGPLEIDALVAEDGLRLLALADEDDREMIADALSDLL